MKLSQITHIAIIAVFAVVMSGAANAEVTCPVVNVSVDMMQGGLEDDEGIEMYYFNEVDGRWTVPFSFGDVSGDAKCINYAYDGETYDDLPSNTEGKYCWFRMTSPVTEAWMEAGETYNSVSACKSDCPSIPAYYAQSRGLSYVTTWW